MPLSNLFQDSEVEYVREICRIPNTADRVATLVDKLDLLNSAQVIATQRDIEQWKRIEFGTEKSKGGIKGTDFDTERNRNHITNKVRDRLGYAALPYTDNENALSILTINQPTWFGSTVEDEYSSEASGDTSDW
jgi:hypothetical protein